MAFLPPQTAHSQVELPRGAAAFAVLARAGLHAPVPVFGLIETEPETGPRKGQVTLHLDARCVGVTALSDSTLTVAPLTEDLLLQANTYDHTMLACYCHPEGHPLTEWLADRSELAALLHVLEYAEDAYDSDEPANAATVGVLRVTVADFEHARRKVATDLADDPDAAVGGIGDPLVAQMTAEALAVVVEVLDELAARVDADDLERWARQHGAVNRGAQPSHVEAEQVVRALTFAPNLAFDCTADPADGGERILATLGVYGWLPTPGGLPFTRHQVALHLPAYVADYASCTGLGPAPNVPETAEDVFAFDRQVRNLMVTWPVEKRPEGGFPALQTLVVGVLTDVPA